MTLSGFFWKSLIGFKTPLGHLMATWGLFGSFAKQGIASHQDKRSLTIADFLAGCPIDPTAPIGTLLNPRIIERKVKRDLSFGPPIRTVLADTAFANDFVCDEAAGFYIVTDEESVIFFHKDEAGVVFAELIVLRDVFGEQGTPESTAICEWFQDIIDTAVNEVAMEHMAGGARRQQVQKRK
ncbi:hypothetical protein R3P38DRAFT_3206992 [Favolaschia claudopus]|uniref:Uncharacterized protein n=1 Tax=Favolaschia claudopus TaxID=2862362 RepID=A0AAW0AK85_9AGAR